MTPPVILIIIVLCLIIIIHLREQTEYTVEPITEDTVHLLSQIKYTIIHISQIKIVTKQPFIVFITIILHIYSNWNAVKGEFANILMMIQ